MTFKVRVLRRAQSDLEEIDRYIRRDRPDAAVRLVTALLDDIASLEQTPERGARPRDERLERLGYRVLIRGEYLVFFKILKSQVRIYRVIHGRRKFAHMI